jgi:hypothetical protein
LKFVKTINRQYDARFAVEGAKNGGTLLIRDPNEYEVTDGAVMNVQDTTETTQTLTVATQKHVAMNFSSLEATMSIDEFDTRVLDPAMSKLAAIVEYTVLAGVYKDVYDLSGTPATTPASLAAVLNGGVKLSQGLAPESDRHVLMDSLAMAATVASMSSYFHKASELEKAFAEGYIGQAAGMKWWESNMVPNHTNGSRVDASSITTITGTVTVPTGGFVNGTATITISGGNNAKTFLAGDIFTVADVYAVNSETKQKYSHLQQWTVTTANTSDAGGAAVLAVSPTPWASGVKQNISIASTGAKAVVYVAAGGSGLQDAVYPQNLAYHRDAFTFVTADLYKDPGARMSSANIEGIAMRLWRGNDIVNDKFPSRIDVLFGFKTIRPAWAVRVRG